MKEQREADGLAFAKLLTDGFAAQNQRGELCREVQGFCGSEKALFYYPGVEYPVAQSLQHFSIIQNANESRSSPNHRKKPLMQNDSGCREVAVLKNGHIFNVLRDGRLFHEQPFWDVVQNGQWEPKTFAIIERHCSPDHVFIDIGAWIGPTTLFAAGIAKHVYAVEPDPVSVVALKKNIALNAGFSHKITVLMAVSETPQEP